MSIDIESRIDFSRQSGIITQSQMNLPIVLIGAGGIGSEVAVTLCKMGIGELTVYDFDKVEPHNLPNQGYRKDDLGKFKVDALKEICTAYSDVDFHAVPERFEDTPRESCIVISGVDSMDSRKEIWKRIKLNPSVKMYIDGRMAREMLKVYRVNPSDLKSIAAYEKTLHSDEDAVEIPCTEKSIIYNVKAVAAFVAHQVRVFFTEQTPCYSNEHFYDFTSGMQLYDYDI